MTFDYFLENSIFDSEEFLYSHKFEKLFSQLENKRNVVYFQLGLSEKSVNFVLDLFKTLDQVPSVLLLTNGDTDLPPIKSKWFSQDFMEFSEEAQREIEKIPLDDLLELSFLEKIPENCTIFCNSVIKDHQKLNMIPLGRDPKGINFVYDKPLNTKKNILVYCNHSIPPKSIHWYGRIREYIYKDCLNKSFVKVDNMSTVQGRDIGKASFINYYQNLLDSKFIICPRGCALDSYRLWDSLYFGCVPIVVKYDGYKQFEDLPILFIDSWQDYMTLDKDNLERIWMEMQEKEYNFDKLKFSWWKNKIQNKINELSV